MAQTLTERADNIALKLQDLQLDVEDDEAVTKLDELIEQLRGIDFHDGIDEEGEDQD
jgi:hypothetical protein